MVKVRDALSSILRSAVRYEFLERNPLERLQLPPDKRGTIDKPLLTPGEFQSLLLLMPEPYASMLYVSVWTGLRVSELSALKWKCIHDDSISIRQRYSRGDWSSTETVASAATIAVEPHVIARIHHLKTLTVDVRADELFDITRSSKATAPRIWYSSQSGRETHERFERSQALHEASRREATAGPGELESTPHQLRDQDGCGGSRPKIGARPDAAFPDLDHARYLRAARSRWPEKGRCEADGMRSRAG